MKIRNYDVSHDGKNIFIDWQRRNKDTERIVLTYSADVYDYICKELLGTISTNGEKGYYISSCIPKMRGGTPVLLHREMYCLYSRGMNMKNYVDVLDDFRVEYGNTGMVIDHLDGDKNNLCSCNLFYTDGKINDTKALIEHRKNGRLRRILGLRHMFYVLKANDGNNIRVQIAYIANAWRDTVKVVNYYCETGEELLDLLDTINRTWFPIDLRNKRAGKFCTDGSYNIVSGYPFPALIQPAHRVYEMQQALVELPLSEFTKWEHQDYIRNEEIFGKRTA